MSADYIAAKVVPTIFCFSLAVFLGVKAYRSRRSENHPTVLCLTTSSLLASVFNLYMMIEPVTLFVSIVIQASLLICLVFARFGLDQYLNGVEYQNPLKSRLFFGTSMSIVVISILCYFHQDSLGSIGDDAYFRWSLELFTSTFLFYALITYIELSIVAIYAKNIRRHTEVTSYVIRRCMCMIGFASGTLFTGVLMLISLLVLLFFGNGWLLLINIWFRAGRSVGFTMFVLGIITPKYILAILSIPINTIRRLYRERQKRALFYLRDMLERIVPGIHRPIRDYVLSIYPIMTSSEEYYYSIIRCNSEITDARRIIWSHVFRYYPITPEEEAMHIFKLLSLNTRLNTAGLHRPAMPNYRFTTGDDISIQQKEIVRYNLCVVRHLKRLISNRQREGFYAVAER
jgi:hypothetical protein